MMDIDDLIEISETHFKNCRTELTTNRYQHYLRGVKLFQRTMGCKINT